MTCITIKTYITMKILMDKSLMYMINTQIYTLAFQHFFLWTFFHVHIDKQRNNDFNKYLFYSHHVWSGRIPCESSEQFEPRTWQQPDSIQYPIVPELWRWGLPATSRTTVQPVPKLYKWTLQIHARHMAARVLKHSSVYTGNYVHSND